MRTRDEGKAREIFRATLEEVEAVGLSGLSMEAVARRAGVATGSVYTYFKGKEALLNALYVETKLNFSRLLAPTEGMPYRAAFDATVRAYLRYLIEKKQEITFMNQMADAPYLSAEARAASAVGLKAAEALVARGRAEGLLKPLDAGLMLAFISGTLRSAAPLAAGASAAQRDALERDVASLCWDALRA